MTDIYKERFKFIKRFVSFHYDMRQNFNNLPVKDKKLISTYYNALKSKIKHSDQIYQPRDKRNIKIVADAFDIDSPLAQLKALPIKRQEGEKVKIKINKKKTSVKISTRHISKIFVPMNPLALVLNVEKEVRKKLRHHTKADFYKWAYFSNEMPPPWFTIDELIEGYEFVVSRYQQENFNGVYVFYTKNQRKRKKGKNRGTKNKNNSRRRL